MRRGRYSVVWQNPTERSDPSPSVLKGEARALFDETYKNAMDYYGTKGLEGGKSALKRTAQATAWKAVRKNYHQINGGWSPVSNPGHGPSTFERPRQVIILGKLIEIVAVCDPPVLDEYTFGDVDLLWDDANKTLVAYPGLDIPVEKNQPLPPSHVQAEMFRRWSKRDPEGFVKVPVKSKKVNPTGIADSVTYRSDKWGPPTKNAPDSQLYIHQHADGVWLELGNGNPPGVVVIRGGSLDVQPGGIVN
jgi:cation transport regulator ChaB